MEPKNQQIEFQGATKHEKTAKLSRKGGKVEPQVLQWSPMAPQSARKTQKKVSKSANEARKCAASAEKTQAHINHTPKTTNQPRKQRETRISKQLNKRTNTHIRNYTNKNPDNTNT